MKKLIEQLKRDNEFYYSEIHGREHYANVMASGIELAEFYNINMNILKYFAYLHDSCRENEDRDPDHGLRAAKYIDKVAHLIHLDSSDLWTLKLACANHTSAKPWDGKSYGLIQEICFDADRSDIGRVCYAVDPAYLFTSRAKELYADEPKSFGSQCL